MAIFADRLNEALTTKNITAAELSRRTGIDEGTISNYKKGKYIPKQYNMNKISKALNVSVAWLLGADDEKPQNTSNVDEILKSTEELLKQPGLSFDNGAPASDECIQSIVDAMRVGLSIAKERSKDNKEK